MATAIEFDHVGKQYRLGLVESIAPVVKQYDTGDRPVLICCSDRKYYLCKYNRFGGPAFSLAREYVGTCFASVWGLIQDKQALVKIKMEHLPDTTSLGNVSNVCLGRMWIQNVADVTEISQQAFPLTKESFDDLLKIALFDLWLCNDDRTANNLNLLFGLDTNKFLPIDHAGIFNTSFSLPLNQLSLYDSLMYSDMFGQYKGQFGSDYDFGALHSSFNVIIERCRLVSKDIIASIPESWNINALDLRNIMDFIFSEKWCFDTWTNFMNLYSEV